MATDIINSANLTPQETLQVPTYQPTPVDPNIAQGALASVAGQYEAVNKQLEQAQREQEANRASQNDLSSALMGKTADVQSFQRTTGVDAANDVLVQQATQLADLNAQASTLNREAQAIPIQVQNESMGRGRTGAGIAPIESARLRDNALKALSIAQQSDIAAAALTGSQLKLQAAKDKAQQMVDLKYKPLEDQLALKKQQYELNKDVLSSIDKKRTETLNAAIKEEERQLADKKELEKGIQNIATTLRGYGISDSIVKDVLSSKDISEAIIKAGNNLQDPRAKLELQSIKAEIALKQAQARKVEREAQLTKEPTQKEKTAMVTAITQAKASAQAAQEKIESIDALLSLDTGISSRVGTSFMSRGIAGPALTSAAVGAGVASVVPGVGTAVGGLAGGIVGASKGIASSLSGQGQQVSGAVHRITHGLTLDKLIEAKKNGATFGALTIPELTMLAASATELNDWEIKDKNGNPTGYWNVDEKTFRSKVKEIQDFSRKAILQSQGTLIAPDESLELDSLFAPEEPTANQYYQ